MPLEALKRAVFVEICDKQSVAFLNFNVKRRSGTGRGTRIGKGGKKTGTTILGEAPTRRAHRVRRAVRRWGVIAPEQLAAVPQ